MTISWTFRIAGRSRTCWRWPGTWDVGVLETPLVGFPLRPVPLLDSNMYSRKMWPSKLPLCPSSVGAVLLVGVWFRGA
eukprot:14075709-Heterocapsa_arctica.AAC.1